MFKSIREDIQAVFARDPAARSMIEVIFCYPGLHALWLHRVAHFLWLHRLKFFARLLSHANRFLTNIEIHPGANIGRRFFIDHGAGVVIGTGAILLGAIVIGDDARIGSGSVVVKPVPAGATVVGVPGSVVEDRRRPLAELEHARLPDPVAETIRLVLDEQDNIKVRLNQLENPSGVIAIADEPEEIRQKVALYFSQGEGI